MDKIGGKTVLSILKNKKESDVSYSLEISPGIKECDIIENNRIMFYSVTWHAKNSSLQPVNLPSLDLAIKMGRMGHHVLLHISCDGMTEKIMDYILETMEINSLFNIFALKGESYEGSPANRFNYASDLVSYIRLKTGNKFCIGVAGYPEGHPSSENMEMDLKYLKLKVTCGADFILTQTVLEYEQFQDFVLSCRNCGINVPIIPGLFLINPSSKLEVLANLCNIRIPLKICSDLKQIAKDTESIKQYGIDAAKEVIDNCIKSNLLLVNHVHFFTLNSVGLIYNFVKNVNF